ncbi:MAG: dihydrolipoyl dehydrogenase family protein [Burkholderiales bacterium]
MKFDVIVIGSGPGGYKAAITAAHLGAKVALVEKGLAGGTCLNQGCIPKETLLHLASLIEDVNGLQGLGLIGTISGDFSAAMIHKNEVVSGIRDNFSVWLKRLGIKVIYGTAKLIDARWVEVDLSDHLAAAGELSADCGSPALLKLNAERIIIASGSEPKTLPHCRIDGEKIITSRDFMFNLTRRPDSILCVGGGAVGVELGFLMHQFGSRVCIAELSDRLLNSPRIPERASVVLERKFKRLGIEVRKETTVQSCVVVEDGVEVTFIDGTKAQYDCVLIATGRKPCIAGLGLADIGIKLTADGYIQTSGYLETSISGIYAVGDVKPGPMTANAALHDAKVAAANAVQGNQLQTNYFKVPVVIHSALEIAAIGLTEEQAENAGFDADVARASFGGSGKARACHDYEGSIEVIYDAETGQLLGGCIIGDEAGEQIHMLSAACQSTRGLWFFKDLSYSHPSWCEELETAIDPCTSAFARSDKTLFRPGILADLMPEEHKA